ncbi:serine protease persephone-like [Battus philenor]|uniref:serine protease persephone-like n=1 Tax=Battus philenor TaxID=42288 RepID=UPI0035CEF113
MCSAYHKPLLLLFVGLILGFSEGFDKLTDRQRSRILSISKDKQKELTPFEKKTDYLYKIIHNRPENKDIEFSPCNSGPLILPDFQEPGRRISEVKCLEHLWKIRYYDEVLLASVICEDRTANNSFIQTNFGGYDAVASEFAHMGAIGWETHTNTWLFMCEGALISERYMLTAAHCSQLPTPDTRVSDIKPKIVRFGENNISDKKEIGKSPEDVYIYKFLLHPYYRTNRKYYDIAIVEFEKDIVFSSKVHPSCIWFDQSDVTGNVELTGWNAIESNKTVMKKEFISDSFDVFTRLTLSRKITDQERNKDDRVSNPVLQVAEVKLMDTMICERITQCRHDGSWRGLLFHQLCAARERKQTNNTECQDIGGILQARLKIPEYTDWNIHYILGVRSFDFGCDFPLTLSVYSKASAFLDWIEEVVWGDT